MAIAIRYPGSPQAADISGLLGGLDAIGAGLEDRRGRKAFDQYLGGLYPQGGQQGQQPMSLAALDQSQGVQRAPLPDVQDPASARVASAHAASGGPQQGAIAAYIRHAAQKRGIDPEIALKVAMSEGGVSDPTRQSEVVKDGQREQSYGPFQLYMGGGLGNEFQQATGLHPSDPGAWQKGIDFALDKAKEGGWGPWYGAAKAGIGERDGIGTPQGAVDALAGQSGQPMPQGAPQAPQMAQGGSMLPPREVMAALFKSRETRPLAIALAQSAQGLAQDQNDPVKRIAYEKALIELQQLRAGGGGEYKVVDDRLVRIGGDGTVSDVTPQGQQGAGPGGFRFDGKSVEAQALNGLIDSGQITPEQAQQLGAGKTISGPNGEIIFMTPQGVFGQAAGGGAPQPLSGGPAPGNIQITEPKVTIDEKKAMTFADRMTTSGKIIDSMGMRGSGKADQIVGGIPLVGEYLTSSDYKKIDQAKRDFINAQLRRESGAVISDVEFENANQQYFPQPNDSPELLEQKRVNRQTVIDGMVRDSGPTYKGADQVIDWKDL